jgi:CBS domain containing-hemolysin-like protein
MSGGTFADGLFGGPFLLAAVDAPATEWEPIWIILLKLLAIFFLVLLNGFFVASEFAIVKVRGSQLDALDNRNTRRVKFARHVVTHLDAYLSTTQLGITLASLSLGWLGEPFLAQMLEPFFAMAGVTSPAVIHGVSFSIAFAIITFLHIVLGELAPKSLAIRKALPTTLWATGPLGIFYVVFKPAIWVLNGAANLILQYVFRIHPVAESELTHSEEELRVILAESQDAQQVSPLEKEILLNVLDLRHLTVRDIMTPRGSVVFLNAADSLAENLRIAKASRHTRFPLCRGHLDETIGLIHIKDLVSLAEEPKPELTSIKRELLAVPEMMTLPRLLKRLLTHHAHMALAVDEFGGTAGMVTLDNVIEELVGPIQDEFDAEAPEFRQLSAGDFVVSGTLSLHELRARTGLDFQHDDVSTVAGYVTAALGHLPGEGEQVKLSGYLATVAQVDSRHIGQLHFRKLATPGAEEA